MADDYRRLAEKVARLEKDLADLQRSPQLAHSSIDGGALRAYDDQGIVRQVIGRQDDGGYTVVDRNGPAPLAPSAPFVTAKPGLLVVAWDGRLEGGQPLPSDFARVEVHVDTSEGFTPTDDTQVATFTSPKGGQVAVALDPDVEHYVALTAANTSGNESGSSVQFSATPLPVAQTSGASTYRSDLEPTGDIDNGDIWIQTPDNVYHRYENGAWVVMPLGPGSIGDDAIEGRHVGKHEVDPESLTVSGLGGAFANVIPDPGFLDDDLNAQRLADADAGGDWQIRTVLNSFTDSFAEGYELQPGPVVQFRHRGYDLIVDIPLGSSITDGQIIASGEAPLSPQPLVGEVMALAIPHPYDYFNATPTAPQYIEIVAQYQDSTGALIGTPVTTGDLDIEPPSWQTPMLNLEMPAAPAGAVGLSIQWIYHGPTHSEDAEGLADWLVLMDVSETERLALTPSLGSEIVIGERFIEIPREAADPTFRYFMPLTSFPAQAGAVYSAALRHQVECPQATTWTDGPHFGIQVFFRDANGNFIYDLEYGYGQRNALHPEWTVTGTDFVAPIGAVRAEVWIYANRGDFDGIARCRFPQVTVSGWYDHGSRSGAWIGLNGSQYVRDSEKLYLFSPDFETGGGLVQSTMNWQVDSVQVGKDGDPSYWTPLTVLQTAYFYYDSKHAAGGGPVVKSPDGSDWRITVDDAGNVSAEWA